MPLEKVRKVLKIAKEPISLETPIGDEEESSIRRSRPRASSRRARCGAPGKRTSRAFPQDGRLLTQPEAGARNGLFGGQEIQSLLHRSLNQ
jgi:hypothetical protein